jgi:queuine tRNA-ribosyltransferase
MSSAYDLVRLANGSVTIRSNADGETFHPVAGPAAEAEALYVRQLDLARRIAGSTHEPFVIWDVGLGAAANPITALRAVSHIASTIHIVSFDRTTAALEFALDQREYLGYLAGFENTIGTLLSDGAVWFPHGELEIHWHVRLGDFPSLLRNGTSILRQAGNRAFPAPHVIFYDAFSPAKNPEMWTLPVWCDLWAFTAPGTHPCALATFSRSTIARVTMLRAGFGVGHGATVAGKEETTVAATRAELIQHPLDQAWLQKARKSHSAEPLLSPEYQQRPLSIESWAALLEHPQFSARQ